GRDVAGRRRHPDLYGRHDRDRSRQEDAARAHLRDLPLPRHHLHDLPPLRKTTMKKDHGKKLSLQAQTVRVLSNAALDGVAGGTTTAMPCTTSVVICPDDTKGKTHHGHHCAPAASNTCTTYMTCPR